MTKKYKILGKFIKDISSETKDIETYLFAKDRITKYKLDIDINYGDYIGYPEKEDRMRYYVVSNDGRVTSDLKHTIGGYKPFYRTITCAYVTPNQFKGI